ncbi:helix-hairpin-helix domain-containing protein [Halobacillus sp. GSS1]|uniref:helix-hairpin-helix domain-containing protein n=1 Tax=Halobacillus sp. GSS1 TaxID=2815919 RepID=UPI001A9076BC|nr:helix-hairpin-helix domain-containing protein [Halobacillus sp. GSS1]MBN9653749.1 helix-hairpin-helix domain-containing protein [Halobacillus sp. GSS1]
MSVLKRYVWFIMVLTVIGVLYFTNPSNDGKTERTEVEEVTIQVEEEKKTPSATMKVDVKGEVNTPGVYTMKEGTRVDDVIKEAGGMTENADMTSVNLAQRIQDEMVIFVTSVTSAQSTSNESGEGDTLSGEKLSINRASASEMETLNGIGPSKAASIIKYREENGPFTSVEDLVNVPGIGEKTLEGLKEWITVP